MKTPDFGFDGTEWDVMHLTVPQLIWLVAQLGQDWMPDEDFTLLYDGQFRDGNEPLACPPCGIRLWGHGVAKRMAELIEDAKHGETVFPVKRAAAFDMAASYVHTHGKA